MTNEKIKLSKDEIAYIKKEIKTIYKSIDSFALQSHIECEELKEGLKNGMPAKIMCCLYERLKLKHYDTKLIIDTIYTLKKEIDYIGMGIESFSAELDYKSNALEKAITRQKFSPEMIEKLKEEFNEWSPLNPKKKISLGVKYADLFNTDEGVNILLDILNQYLQNQELDHIIFLSENIELFCYIDSYDWEFLYLIQGISQDDLNSIKGFMKEISVLNGKEWKYNQCMKMKEYQSHSNEGYNHSSKQANIEHIKNSIKQYQKDNGLRYITIMLLLNMLPYIFYMDSCDWEMLGIFSLLEDWNDRKKLFLRKEWTINFVRGIAYSR